MLIPELDLALPTVIASALPGGKGEVGVVTLECVLPLGRVMAI